MKILNLKFKNINSLSGENEIDFTNPIFTNDGLFAITGKTGAGKSSILDAIALSLYGKTPRVDITANENAVMTRGEKDCYAEIIFMVAGKKWKSSWKQELNRNGNLKPVNRVIADADDKIIADQIRTCDAEIVKIIGLSFEQFTKVIMLAQGSFAAFLQAKQNEKGELLEQITGTEIYAEISKSVYERYKDEKEKLKTIQAEYDAIKILSDEEIETIQLEIESLDKEKQEADATLQKIETAKKWLADIEILQTQINEAKQKLPELEARALTEKTLFEQAAERLKITKEEQKKYEPIFKQVRALDIKISEKEKALQPILHSINELDKNKTLLSKTLQNKTEELKKAQLQLKQKQAWAIENKKYETLVGTYIAIEKENQILTTSAHQIVQLNDEIYNLEKELNEKRNLTKSTTDIFIGKEKTLSLKIAALEKERAVLSETLAGKELYKLREEKEEISNFGTLLKSWIEVENSFNATQNNIQNYTQQLQQIEEEKSKLSNTISAYKKDREALENKINLLNENIQLTKTIQSLETHRQHLKDGEECPLCGALEHPFAIGNIPEIGEKEQALSELKQQQNKVISTMQQDERMFAKLLSDKENTQKNKEKEEGILLDNTTKQSDILREIKIIYPQFSIPAQADKIEQLNIILSQKRSELVALNHIIAQASKSEIQIAQIRDVEIPQLQQEKQSTEKSKNDADTAQKLAEQQFNAKQDALKEKQTTHQIAQHDFLEKLRTYNADNIETLKQHLNDWNKCQQQTEELNQQIYTTKSGIELITKDIDNQTKLLNDKTKEWQTSAAEQQHLSAQRKEIFNDKIVEVEENRLQNLLEKNEAAKANAEKDKADITTEIGKNNAIIREKEIEFEAKKNLHLTENTQEELQTAWSEKKKSTDELSQKIGANNQKLIANSEHLKTSSSKLKEKEKQQAICNKWSILNNLIGSGDGKKYRNFAQALTFEHLIALSNKQLQKMSERYLLKRTGDNLNPFELSVIDTFQNNEERTAQNLSGGEKFIISLSLALGLANMASKNMRIDTMFIDEGFGTLDSDYLDIALNALSNLQSEGKIIGVISHLSELKERIATHIEVMPSGNGHSKIQITSL